MGRRSVIAYAWVLFPQETPSELPNNVAAMLGVHAHVLCI